MNEELDNLWRAADAHVRAPLGFEERLFARLERETRVALPATAREAMPFWVRIAAERHVAFAFLFAGLVVLSPAWWLSAAAPVNAALASFVRLAAAALAPWLAPLAHAPNAGLALALALAPWLAWGSYRLVFAIERRTARAALAPRG